MADTQTACPCHKDFCQKYLGTLEPGYYCQKRPAPPVAMSTPTEPVEKPTLEQEVAALRHRLTTLERRFDTLQAQTRNY